MTGASPMLNNLTRRDMLKKLGTIGAVGVTSALLPSWMPKLAFAQ
ncbi:MAG: twin-arginine translocation signal domain-containing protein, partial [Anaerolineae bacterium]|nr:twin-arginine translocation signal domain-containing protein [Anaerolineae bacterium]